MGTDLSREESSLPLPKDIATRLSYWHGLWNRSAMYHYFFGVIAVAASVISTSLDGPPAKVFSIIAAISAALIGFMHPERRYMKFVRAWRVLDAAAMRYQHGLIDKAKLIDALEHGENLIGEFEDRYAAAQAEKKEPEAGAEEGAGEAAEAPTDGSAPGR
jgi:hypothetical protein